MKGQVYPVLSSLSAELGDASLLAATRGGSKDHEGRARSVSFLNFLFLLLCAAFVFTHKILSLSLFLVFFIRIDISMEMSIWKIPLFFFI